MMHENTPVLSADLRGRVALVTGAAQGMGYAVASTLAARGASIVINDANVATDGIMANAVCPGLIDTEMVRSTISDERVREYEQSFPIPRLGRPEEVAELVAFLASDSAAYITGASPDINGGDLMI